MNVEGYFRAMGKSIVADDKRKLTRQERGEALLAMWQTVSTMPNFSARLKEIGDGHAANLRGTIKGYPGVDSIRCMSLIDDLERCLRKGQA